MGRKERKNFGLALIVSGVIGMTMFSGFGTYFSKKQSEVLGQQSIDIIQDTLYLANEFKDIYENLIENWNELSDEKKVKSLRGIYDGLNEYEKLLDTPAYYKAMYERSMQERYKQKTKQSRDLAFLGLGFFGTGLCVYPTSKREEED